MSIEVKIPSANDGSEASLRVLEEDDNETVSISITGPGSGQQQATVVVTVYRHDLERALKATE